MSNQLINTYENSTCELQLISILNALSSKDAELKFITYIEDPAGRHLNGSKCSLFIHLYLEKGSKTSYPLQFWSEYFYNQRREIKKQNGKVLLSGQCEDEINQSPSDPSDDLIDLLVKLKLAQLHYRIKVWYASQKSVYPKMLCQNVIAPMLPLIKHPRDSTVTKIKTSKVLQASFVQMPGLSIDKLLADPVFAQNSTYRQIADKSNLARKLGNNNEKESFNDREMGTNPKRNYVIAM